MPHESPQIVYFAPSTRAHPLLAVLGELGAEVHHCHSDLDALALVLRGVGDLVLVEQLGQVPERFYRILRRRAEQQALGIIAVLPDSDPVQASAALRAGADAILLGRASLEEVASVVEAQLRQHRLRAETLQEQSVLSRVLDFVDEGILLMNREGRVLHANRSCLKLLDLDPDVLRERSVPQLLNVLGVPRDTIDRVMQSEEAFLENIEVHTLEGTKNVVVDCRRLPDAPGDRQRRWLVQLRDASLIHELDRMEAEFQSWAGHELRSHLSLLTAGMEALEFSEEPVDRAGVSESMRREVESLAASIEARLAEIGHDGVSNADVLENISLLSWLEAGLTEVEALALVRGQLIALDIAPSLRDLVFRARVTPMQQILRYVLVDALGVSGDGARISICPSIEGDDLLVTIRSNAVPGGPSRGGSESGLSGELSSARRILRDEGGELRCGIGASVETHLRVPLLIHRSAPISI